jgi:acetyl-CoA carboxylase carboxyltransferase component
MSWKPEIEELSKRQALAQELGGPERVERQRQAGKLTVRERIEGIVDAGSFRESGAAAGAASYDAEGRLQALLPANFVCGVAEIDGRPVMVSGDDFTVRGGSNEAQIPAKRHFSERLALELGLPHVRLVDGMGGGGSVKMIEKYGRTMIPQMAGWETVVEHLSVAPSVALALGSVAGLGAARVVTSHYSMIVEGTAQMMIAGPALVEQAGQREVSKEELGHARVHTSNGAIDDVVKTEAEGFERARRFLSYLPRNVDELPPRVEATDDPARRDERLLGIVPRNPRQVYKMRDVISGVFDEGSFFEIGKAWGRSAITGLARLDGWPVAIFSEDPYVYGGAWTADASQKIIRLLDLASTFHLPVIHLEDCPGFLIGKQSEDDATIRHGSRALAALGQCTSPFCCVVIRKAFGVAGASNSKPGSTHPRWSWPSGDWHSLPVEGGIEVAYRRELAGLEGEAFERELASIRERLDAFRSPFRAAEFFEIDDVIDPRDTRRILCQWASLVADARRPGSPAFGYRP